VRITKEWPLPPSSETLGFYNFDNVSEKSAIHHVLFIGVFLVFLDLINRLTCKISFFYEAMNELGLKLEEKAKRIERKL